MLYHKEKRLCFIEEKKDHALLRREEIMLYLQKKREDPALLNGIPVTSSHCL